MGWFSKPEPQHVLLTVLHEGVPAGDVTVDGWIVGKRDDQLMLDRARILLSDNTTKPERDKPGVMLEVPISRIILRQPISTVSVAQLEAMVA